MIKTANIGVGLVGKEGTQAAQCSDFVIHRFRYLKRLLFIHGRFSYLRSSKVVLWSFYKNALFPMPLFLYGFSNAWSSQTLYDSIILNLFNMLLTQIPVLLIGWTEKDYGSEHLMQHPEKYPIFRDNETFSLSRFILAMSVGILQGTVIYLIAYFMFVDVMTPDGLVSGLWVFGHYICSATIVVVNLVFWITTSNRTIAMVASFMIGIFFYVLVLLVYGSTKVLSFEMFGVPLRMFGATSFYVYLFITCIICVLPVMIWYK